MTSLDFLPPLAGVYVASLSDFPSTSACEEMPDYDHTPAERRDAAGEQTESGPTVTAKSHQG